MTKDLQNNEEKLKLLYEYLQDKTRYINVSIETGGIKPYPASYVVENGYGDCKALSVYYKAMLDAVGIKAYYTLVRAGSKVYTINKNLPCSQFNHAIIYVPLERDTFFIDCTSSYPFNYTSSFIQNREALIIDGINSFFAEIPKSAADEVLTERKIIIDNTGSQDSKVTIDYSCRGEEYEFLRGISNDLNRKNIENYILKHFLPRNCELNSFEILDYERDDIMIHLEIDAASKSLFKSYGNDVFVEIFPFNIPDFEKPECRSFPVQFITPICNKDSLVYNISGYKNFSQELQNIELETEFGQYSRSVEAQGDQIIVTKSFKIKAGVINPEKYSDFYTFINKVAENEKNASIILNR